MTKVLPSPSTLPMKYATGVTYNTKFYSGENRTKNNALKMIARTHPYAGSDDL